MGFVFSQALKAPQVVQLSPVILDSDAARAVWRHSGAFLPHWLEFPGLQGAVTIPEVLDQARDSVLIQFEGDAARIEEFLAHEEGMTADIGHIVLPSPQLLEVQTRFLQNPDVARLVSMNAIWRLRAVVAAMAIEFGMPVLGRSRFWRELAKTRPIPAGVVDHHIGQWLVPPT